MRLLPSPLKNSIGLPPVQNCENTHNIGIVYHRYYLFPNSNIVCMKV